MSPKEVLYSTGRFSQTQGIVRYARHREAENGHQTGNASQDSLDIAGPTLLASGLSQRAQILAASNVSHERSSPAQTTPSNSLRNSDSLEAGDAPETKPLGLEYYFIDSWSTNLENAYNTYGQIRASQAQGIGTKIYSVAALRAGILLNGLRRNLGPVSLQLSTVIIEAANSVKLHEDWNTLDPTNLTPSRVILAMHNSEPNIGNVLIFRTGLWQNKSHSISEFQRMKRSNGYIGLIPVFFSVLEFNKRMIAEIEQKRINNVPYEEEERLLSLNFSEHWALNLIFTLTDYGDPTSTLPFALPQEYNFELPVWLKAMKLMHLELHQLRQCKSARAHLRGHTKRIEDSNCRLQEAFSHFLSFPIERTTEESILNIVEDLRRNELYLRRVIVETGFVFLFKILSPFQAALFYGFIQTESVYPIAHFMDWMRSIHKFLTGPLESSWLDTFVATPPRQGA